MFIDLMWQVCYNVSMEKKDNRSFLRSGLIIAAFAILLYTLLQRPAVLEGAVSWLWNVFSPVILGMCFAFVMNVALTYVEKGLTFISRGRLKKVLLRTLGIFITILLLFGVIVLLLYGIIPAIGDMVGQLVSYLPQATGATQWMEENLTELGMSEEAVSGIVSQLNNVVDQLLEFLKREYLEIANVALSATTSIFDALMSFVVSLIFAIYILACKERAGRFCVDVMHRFVKEKWCERIVEVCHLSFYSFSAFVKGQLLEAGILGILCFIGMVIFGFPNAAVVSLLIGVTALIPIFGAWIGAGISALLILIVSPIKALLFLAFILILQQLEGNLIYPRVVGQSMGMPGIIVLAAVTLGGNIAGIAGMLLGVPICAVLYTLLKQAVYGKKSVAETK